MALCLIFWGEDIVSRAWMVLTKPAMVFLWLGGSILDHKNEPIYPSWKQDSFQNAFANLQFGLVVWVWAGRMENAHLHL